MGDDDESVVGVLELVHAGSHDAQGIHVQAGVGLVEDGQAGFEHRHLEDFVAFLLAARAAYVHAAPREAAVHLHISHLFAHQLEELGGGQGLEAALLALLVDGGFHEVDIAHAGNLHRILEAQENAGPGAFLGRKGQQVAAVVGDGAFCDGKSVASRQDGREGALAGAVGPHYCVDFTRLDFQVDAAENLFLTDGCVQVFDLKQSFHQAFRLYIFSQL